MTISYPLSMPNSKLIRTSVWRTRTAVSVTESPFTFEQQVQIHDGQAWRASVTLPQLKGDEARDWIAFLISLKGPRGTFMLGDSTHTELRGLGGGTPLVKGAGQTGETLLTDGWPVSQTGTVKPGDYIQVGQRLYMVLTQGDSNGSGEITLDIYPRLRESPADNAAITTSNTKGLFRLADDDYDIFTANEGKWNVMGFEAIEAV